MRAAPMISFDTWKGCKRREQAPYIFITSSSSAAYFVPMTSSFLDILCAPEIMDDGDVGADGGFEGDEEVGCNGWAGG